MVPRLASPPHFVCNFSRKIFLMSYSIDWQNFIASLPLILEMLGNMCIAIICGLLCDVINCETNHSFHASCFHFYKGLSLKVRKTNFSECESPTLI